VYSDKLNKSVRQVSGVQQLFLALHAPLPCTTLLARGYVHYWKRRRRRSNM